MAKKKKKQHEAVLAQNNDQRVRLREIEEMIQSWMATGRLWDDQDAYVKSILEERDQLFYEINPHLTGLSFHDMNDAQWDEIDRKHQEECEKEDPYGDDD